MSTGCEMMIYFAALIAAAFIVTVGIKIKNRKKKKSEGNNSFEKTADIFYQNMSEPLCVIYHFVVIGSSLLKNDINLIRINRDNDNDFCDLFFKSDYNYKILSLAKDSPVLNIDEDKTTENKIEFNIKFVICKASQLANIIDNGIYRNSIILVCDRNRAMMSVFTNINGKLENRLDFRCLNSLESRYFNLYHLLTTRENDDSLKYGAAYPYTYIGDLSPELIQDRVNIVFKILTRFNPEYVPSYSYDY